MAIDVSGATAAAKTAIINEFKTQFPDSDPPSSLDDIADGLGEVVALAVQYALQEVKDNADLTGVTSGSDTVPGGVD